MHTVHKMRPFATDVARSVAVCLGCSHEWAVQNGWTDWGAVWWLTGVGPRNHVLNGSRDPTREGAILVRCPVARPIESIKFGVSSAVYAAKEIIQSSITARYAMRPFVKIPWPLVVIIIIITITTTTTITTVTKQRLTTSRMSITPRVILVLQSMNVMIDSVGTDLARDIRLCQGALHRPTTTLSPEQRCLPIAPPFDLLCTHNTSVHAVVHTELCMSSMNGVQYKLATTTSEKIRKSFFRVEYSVFNEWELDTTGHFGEEYLQEAIPQYQGKSMAGKMSRKWPIRCRVGRKTVTQSINQGNPLHWYQ